jgi:sulfur carrier protein
VKAILIIGGKEIVIDKKITIEDAVLSQGEHPDAFLYLIDKRPVPMTTVFDDSVTVNALRVASGG